MTPLTYQVVEICYRKQDEYVKIGERFPIEYFGTEKEKNASL